MFFSYPTKQLGSGLSRCSQQRYTHPATVFREIIVTEEYLANRGCNTGFVKLKWGYIMFWLWEIAFLHCYVQQQISKNVYSGQILMFRTVSNNHFRFLYVCVSVMYTLYYISLNKLQYNSEFLSVISHIQNPKMLNYKYLNYYTILLLLLANIQSELIMN